MRFSPIHDLVYPAAVVMIVAGLSCTKNEYSYTYITEPAPPAGPAYTFVTAYVVTTQTVLPTGAPYSPEYIAYCANAKAIPRHPALSGEAPYWNIIGDWLPWYRLNVDSQILQVYNMTFQVDTALKGVYWWADLHQQGDCVAPGGDMDGIYQVPAPIGIDSTLFLTRFLPGGGVTISMHGEERTIAALDSARFFARQETLAVYRIIPPDTTARWYGVLQRDTIVIRNLGLLPKKLILFEEVPWM